MTQKMLLSCIFELPGGFYAFLQIFKNLALALNFDENSSLRISFQNSPSGCQINEPYFCQHGMACIVSIIAMVTSLVR